jgi:NAD(P)-dependent dehydrogenase (short-subunit alcohol dehydrogenase family)
MKVARQGSIINIASIASLVGTPGGAAYCASKGAVLALTRSVALHCAARGYGIRVNAIHPGPVRTPMVMKYASENPQFLAGMQAAIPLGTLGDPMDIANGALYFASDESKWVTGSSLVIDGGYTAQ